MLSLLSIVVCFQYYKALGYNVFVTTIKSIFTHAIDQETIINLRLNAYASGTYRGAGYVYQFRNIILPLTNIALFYYAKRLNNQLLKWFSFALIPFVIFFSLGTGQRGGFVIISLILINSMYYLSKMKISKYLKFFLLFFFLFSIVSFGLGRTNLSDSNSIYSTIIQSLQSLTKRIVNDNQITSVLGFRYVYNEPQQWGKDWLLMFKDVLPGRNEYVSLSTRIFALAYGGSTRGTAPPSIWGSVWYNFGLIGILVIPIFISLVYSKIYHLFLSKENGIIRTVTFSSLFILMGFWIADGPMSLVNSGLVTIILIYLLVQKFTIITMTKRNGSKGHVYEKN